MSVTPEVFQVPMGPFGPVHSPTADFPKHVFTAAESSALDRGAKVVVAVVVVVVVIVVLVVVVVVVVVAVVVTRDTAFETIFDVYKFISNMTAYSNLNAVFSL